MSAHSSDSGHHVSVVGRVLGPFARAQTYRNLLYLFLRFPLGVAYFTVFFTMISVGVVLVPLLVGVPILALTVAGVGYVGAFEARLTRALLGVDVSYAPPDPEEVPLKPYLKRAVTTPHNYALLTAAFAAFPLGIFAFLLLTLAVSLSAVLVLAPVLYPLPGVTYGISTAAIGGETIYSVQSFPEALALSVVGVVVAVVSVHVVNAAVRFLSGLTVLLLDERGESSQ